MTDEEEKEIDLIEGYHKGTLSADELAMVQQRMSTDPEFAGKVADFTDIMKGIKSHEQKQFSENVASWEKEIQSGNKTSSKFILRIAAALVVIVLTSVVIFSRISGSNDDLYAKHFEPYEDVINVRGSTDQLLSEGMNAYNQKDYKKASDVLYRYVNANPSDLNAQFYLGISSIEAGKAGEGIRYLDNVIEARGMLVEQAQWYLALAYLKEGDLTSCQRELKEIDVQGHDYRERAERLLEDLK